MEVLWVIGIVLFLVGFACGSAFAWNVAKEEFGEQPQWSPGLDVLDDPPPSVDRYRPELDNSK